MFSKEKKPAAEETPELVVPEQFRRASLEESLAVVIESHAQAQRKITHQAVELGYLRDEAAELRRQVGELSAMAEGFEGEELRRLRGENGELRRRLAEHENRDREVALIAALAAGGVA